MTLISFIKQLFAIKAPTVSVTVQITAPQVDEHLRKQCSEIGIPLEQPPVCPYCSTPLKKRPAKKTQCPSCREFMYVRTRPKDNMRVLVTKVQAETVDEQWRIVTGTQEAYLARQEEENRAKEEIRSRLQQKFGKEASERDVQWAYLNKQRLQHGLKNNWGLYRNTTFQMAEQVRKEKHLKTAVALYLEVCFYDLNGPENRGGLDRNWLKEFPPFDLKSAFLAPGIVSWVEEISVQLKLSLEEVKGIFLEHNNKIYKGLAFLRAPEICWPLLQKELDKVIKNGENGQAS